jgi:hypothetical protein
LPLDFSYPYTEPPEPLFLGPKAIEKSSVFEMTGARALIHGGAGQGGDGLGPRMFVWGRADYQDMFGGRHFIQWCYLIRFERHDGKNLRAHFIQWGDYNRSDEDDLAY